LENKIRYTLSKEERLKGRKEIDALFKNAKSFSVPPLRILYQSHKEDNIAAIRVGFTVSTKYFKKAVDRNRIKRLLRESYRLQKHTLINRLNEVNSKMNIFFIYTGKEMSDYTYLFEKTGKAIKKLESNLNVQ
jgi:ribonuclease P protein component